MAGKTLKAHPVMGDSLQSVYDVLQTTLAGRSLRLTMDPKAGSIVALADDQVHQEIEKTIKEVQGPAVEFAVIDINRLDPYFVVNLIGELFGTNEETSNSSSSGYRSRDRDEDEEAAKPKGPRVDADPANRRLFVRGTADQIRQIRELVEGLGPQTTTSSRERLRLLPLASQRRQQILDAAERFWEGDNEIVILPGSSDIDQESTVIEKAIHPMRPAAQAIGSPLPKSTRPAVATPAPGRTKSPSKAAPAQGLDTASPAADPTDRAEAQSPSAASGFVASAEQPGDATTLIAGKDGRVETSPIRGRLVPQGILIESDDPDALDRFQEHLMDIATTSGRTPSPPVVFYLKYVTADQAVKMLADLFDGGKSLAMTPTSGLVSGSSSSDYYFGSLTSSKDGLTTVTAGTATIVSDARLNRLIIQGTTDDVATIEGYLKIIDKGESLTNIETAGRSHVIELLHTNATDMAAVIREAYAGRVATAGSKPGQPGAPGQPGQPPRPEDRGNDGDRGRDGEGNRDRREMIDRPTRDKQPEMTVAVHQPSNSLVVTAPDSLFAEVEQLVRSVDTRGERVIEVIPAGQGVDMESILKKLQGDESAIPSASRPSSSSGGSDSSSRSFGGSRDDRDRDRDRDRSR
jgi:type II secretory pathway component GspD/PulD (secretin)